MCSLLHRLLWNGSFLSFAFEHSFHSFLLSFSICSFVFFNRNKKDFFISPPLYQFARISHVYVCVFVCMHLVFLAPVDDDIASNVLQLKSILNIYIKCNYNMVYIEYGSFYLCPSHFRQLVVCVCVFACVWLEFFVFPFSVCIFDLFVLFSLLRIVLLAFGCFSFYRFWFALARTTLFAKVLCLFAFCLFVGEFCV